jgi:FkbM family methyltransferase
MDQWFSTIIHRMFESMHRIEADNFDADRYRGSAANSFFFAQHASYLLFLEAHRSEFHGARSLLADEPSRLLFDQLVLFRLLGHHHVRLPFNTAATRNYHATTDVWKVEETADIGVLGALSIFAIPLDDDVLCFKCWHGNIAANLIFHQYYFDRDGVRIAPTLGDHALDVGGCFGDTALFFARDVGPSGCVYTFDPMPKHCSIMRETFAMNPDFSDRIKLFGFGLSDANSAGSTSTRQGIDPGARLSDDLPTRTLDCLNLPRVDFIKMDIEGAELMALKGGEQVIRQWRPRLAISLYHRPEDFFAIPFWLDSLRLGYRFFLDHYSIHHEETVLYAAV